MNCEIILDLLPLYADDCCSDESRRLVEHHLASCEGCRTALAAMQEPAERLPVNPAPQRLRLWEASCLQAGLSFAAFALMALGVTLESRTPAGPLNGLWAFTLIIPATGFLLGLVNWYFLRQYRSRRQFCLGSAGITGLLCALCCAWGCLHYDAPRLLPCLMLCGVGTVFSFLLAGCFARLTGKV